MPDGKPYTEIGEFKGHATITVFTGHEYQGKKEYVTLGLRKAKAVADCIDAIYAFVDGKEKEGKPPF